MEKVLQYIWGNRLWPQRTMKTVDGRPFVILDPGSMNNGSGPDFFNAKIRLDGKVWSGDVEIHVKASDWYKHKHDTDPAYNSVILHVVAKDDAPVTLPGTGETIPQVRLNFTERLAENYRRLLNNAPNRLPCAQDIKEFRPIIITDWITALAYERLIGKSERIGALLEQTVSNWEEVCYITLARALGTGTNGEPLERLAKSVPLHIIRKHSDNILALESIFFGQAGFLENEISYNSYYSRLREEFRFMAAKFGLTAPISLNWKTGGMRPAASPHRRIALLATFVEGGFNLMSRLVEARSLEEACKCFDKEMRGYWTTHSNFSGYESDSNSRLNASTIDSLIINVAIPLIYAYGYYHLTGREADEYRERAVDWLCSLKAEKNFITTLFANSGIKCENAFMSQAVIQLRRNYCETKKCIYCRFGHRILAKDVISG